MSSRTKQKYHPVAMGLSLLFLALLLLSLLLRFWASDRAWEISGPTHIAASAGQVFVYAADEIYHLSFAGELLARFSAEVTGLEDDPIDLRFDQSGANGEGQLLIAEQQPARIRSCDTKSWDCTLINTDLADRLERQFKVLLSTAEHDMLVTDARGDTLWGIPAREGDPQRLVPDQSLAGPNDLAFDGQDNLWVADTDHRRIVELVPSVDGLFEPGREHSAMNELTVSERHFPVMMSLAPDGTLWVTQAAEFSNRYGDLVIYDPDQGAIARVDMPGSVFATDVVAAGEDMLVTDLDQFAVYRVDSKSYQVSAFGDEKFTNLMSGFRERREQALRLSTLAMVAVVVFGALMVAAAIVATPRNKRWTPQPGLIDPAAAAQEVPKVSGIHWLQRNPSVERALKWGELAGFSILILMLVGGLGLYVWVMYTTGSDPGEDLQEKLQSLALFMLIGGLMLIASFPLLIYGMRAMKRKLGTDGRQVYIRLYNGRELVVAPAELAYTKQSVLYRQYSIPVKTGQQKSIYLEGEVETWLAPLLRQATQLSPVQGLKHQWKHRDPLLMWSLGLTLALTPVLLFLFLFAKL